MVFLENRNYIPGNVNTSTVSTLSSSFVSDIATTSYSATGTSNAFINLGTYYLFNPPTLSNPTGGSLTTFSIYHYELQKTFDSSITNGEYYLPVPFVYNKELQFKQKIRNNLLIERKGRINFCNVFGSVSKSENAALVLLKKILCNNDLWRRYLTYGFILVKGNSGLFYKITRNNSHVTVYRKGVIVAELCIALSPLIPPTDNVIAKKLLIEADEIDIWHRANIYTKNSKLVSSLRKDQFSIKEENLLEIMTEN